MTTLKRIASYLIAGIFGLIFLTLSAVQMVLKSVGAADDIRSLANPSWWRQGLAWLLGLNPTLPLLIGLLFVCWFLFLITRDAGRGTAALTAVRASNDKAWQFQGEYQAFRDRIDGRLAEVLDALTVLTESNRRASDEYQKLTGVVRQSSQEAIDELEAANRKALDEIIHGRVVAEGGRINLKITEQLQRRHESQQRYYHDVTANILGEIRATAGEVEAQLKSLLGSGSEIQP